ncbi:helix-turn-helix transcriptional regulator [Lactobacillus iners]|uniref:helix-turn-helix transcriptional regulator n=1 Tax=Lactobacillus iners TaxID=147802 RepID=UPI001F08C0A2|nr:helix-turn-helix transcriptional regulator [Lactobacillus iners]
MKFTIKQARNYTGKTQAEIAKELGVALPTYREYEHGNIQMKVEKAKLFAEIVNIPLDNIIFF